MESQLSQSAPSFFLYFFLNGVCCLRASVSCAGLHQRGGGVGSSASSSQIWHMNNCAASWPLLHVDCGRTPASRPWWANARGKGAGWVSAPHQSIHPHPTGRIPIYISRLLLPIGSWIQPFPSVCGWHLSRDELDMSQPSSTAQCRGRLVWTVLCLFCPFEVLLCLLKCCLNAAPSCVRAGGLDIGQSHSREVWKPEPPSSSQSESLRSHFICANKPH